MLNDRDQRLLRLAIAISARSREGGNHPFGAVLADEDGEVLLGGREHRGHHRDVAGHAETNLIGTASSSSMASAKPTRLLPGAGGPPRRRRSRGHPARSTAGAGRPACRFPRLSREHREDRRRCQEPHAAGRPRSGLAIPRSKPDAPRGEGAHQGHGLSVSDMCQSGSRSDAGMAPPWRSGAGAGRPGPGG